MSALLVRERGRILLLSGFVLVGAIAFQTGFLQGSAIAAKPVIVERPDTSSCQGGQVAGVSAETVAPGTKATQAGSVGTVNPAGCAFVGSKNSTLYHLPSCASAKRIKPENLVCFSSVEDATARGYKAGCVK